MTGETVVAAVITGAPGLAAGIAGLWQARSARQQAERAKEKGVDAGAWDRAQRITDRAVERLERQLARVEAELEAERQARRAADAEIDRLRRLLAANGITEPGGGAR